MPKQSELPGTEGPRIKDIEGAADAYVIVRDKRMALIPEEVEAKANLITIMQAHLKELDTDDKGNPCYRFDDQIVRLKAGKPNVSVRVEAGDDEDDDDGDDDQQT